MKRIAVVVVLSACLAMSTGCMSRAIKEGIGAATGAKGITVVSQAPPMLGGYTHFVVEPFGDQSPTGVPSGVTDSLPRFVAENLADKKIPNEAGGKTLTIRGTYIYSEDANNTTDQVFGPFEEVIARVELVSGGSVIGRATCVGRSTESVNKGPEKKAQGLAKAIVNWIDKNYPPRP